MPKLGLLSVSQIKLNTEGFEHVKMPKAGFRIVVSVDKRLEAVLENPKLRKLIDEACQKAYKKFLLQTAKRLQKFEKLFAGMLAKGAAPAAVAKQALILKNAMEKEVPKWEKLAGRDALEALKKLAAKKR